MARVHLDGVTIDVSTHFPSRRPPRIADPDVIVSANNELRLECPYHRRSLIQLHAPGWKFFCCPRLGKDPSPTDCDYRLDGKRAVRIKRRITEALSLTQFSPMENLDKELATPDEHKPKTLARRLDTAS